MYFFFFSVLNCRRLQWIISSWDQYRLRLYLCYHFCLLYLSQKYQTNQADEFPLFPSFFFFLYLQTQIRDLKNKTSSTVSQSFHDLIALQLFFKKLCLSIFSFVQTFNLNTSVPSPRFQEGKFHWRGGLCWGSLLPFPRALGGLYHRGCSSQQEQGTDLAVNLQLTPQDRGSFYEDQRAKNQSHKGKKEPLLEEVAIGSKKPNQVGGRQSPLGRYQAFKQL